jgi:hypothetical protein
MENGGGEMGTRTYLKEQARCDEEACNNSYIGGRGGSITVGGWPGKKM